MRVLSRRAFLQDSTLFAAALAGAGAAQSRSQGAPTEEKQGRVGANEQLRVAVVGVKGRGMSHVDGFAARNGCIITTICDADEAVIGPAMSLVEKRQQKAPTFEQDIRKVVADPNIDIITIATPNHWHALAAIWALQNGKDVYVEKPVSHNVSEGRRIVETARKYKKICQAGTQSRSSAGMRDAIAYLHAGKIGKVKLARGLCYKLRGSIGKSTEPTPIPKSVDYDLWCGPAPKKPLMRKRLHYDWHWIWDYGNGDLGNQGIHEMDKARWGLNKNELPRSVTSLGGRFGYIDDGETANTQLCFFDYGDCELIFEVRGLPSSSPYPATALTPGKGPQNFVGNIWYGDEGIVVCPNYTSGVALTPKGEVIKRFSGPEDHFANFIKAVHSRKVEDLNGDILEGHLSSALCHLGNISYRLGTEQPFNKKLGSLGDGEAPAREAAEAVEGMVEHLKSNNVMLDKMSYRVGRKLRIDATKETFINDKEADLMLTRDYRKGFEVPAHI
jgi:predicted dehydrogenase